MSLIGDVINAGVSLFAGDKAAKSQQKAIDAAQGQVREGRDLAFGALDTGADAATEYLSPMVPLGDRARQYLASIMATPASRLTPSQQIQHEDTLRTTKQALAGGGLRGAGRAGTAVLGDVARRSLAGFQDQNQKRSDAAAAGLESRGATARTNLAQTEQQRGTSKATSATGTASQLASLEAGSGAVDAAKWGNIASSVDGVINPTPSVVDLISAIRPSDDKRYVYGS